MRGGEKKRHRERGREGVTRYGVRGGEKKRHREREEGKG